MQIHTEVQSSDSLQSSRAVLENSNNARHFTLSTTGNLVRSSSELNTANHCRVALLHVVASFFCHSLFVYIQSVSTCQEKKRISIRFQRKENGQSVTSNINSLSIVHGGTK